MSDLFGVTESCKIDQYVAEWRRRGYPNYDRLDYNHRREMDSLIQFDEKTIFRGGVIKQTMHSCGFLWTYFPHWVDVRCNGADSISDLWDNDDKLKELITKTYAYEQKHGSGYITKNRLRQNSKVYLSKQSVSNFRPTASKLIYNTYGNSGVVWDMSCGWGGRLLGFLASDCKEYIGTEPSGETCDGLEQIKSDYAYMGKRVTINRMGSEDFIPVADSLDLCFTSPPYFDTEAYSNEPTQSYIRYPDKDRWVDGYLYRTMQNCFIGLKIGGKMMINIANTGKIDWLEDETMRQAIRAGFVISGTIRLELSSISGNGAKHEPIFIFTKP